MDVAASEFYGASDNSYDLNFKEDVSFLSSSFHGDLGSARVCAFVSQITHKIRSRFFCDLVAFVGNECIT